MRASSVLIRCHRLEASSPRDGWAIPGYHSNTLYELNTGKYIRNLICPYNICPSGTLNHSMAKSQIGEPCNSLFWVEVITQSILRHVKWSSKGIQVASELKNTRKPI